MEIKIIVKIIEWVGYLFAVIGAGVTVYKGIQVWVNYQKITWGDVDKYTKKIIAQIVKDRFTPDIIVTIGRGGAIIGSILSGNLPKTNSLSYNIPILGTDRVYIWCDGQRNEIENKMIDFRPLESKTILLVAGDVITGETMKFYANEINSVGVKDLKAACLVKAVNSIFSPDYFGKEISAHFKLPWMYKGYDYIRDSRKPC